MKYYLMVFLLVGNDGWRIGDRLDGEEYAPQEFVTIEACLEQRSDNQRNVMVPNGIREIHWACVPDLEEDN